MGGPRLRWLSLPCPALPCPPTMVWYTLLGPYDLVTAALKEAGPSPPAGVLLKSGGAAATTKHCPAVPRACCTYKQSCLVQLVLLCVRCTAGLVLTVGKYVTPRGTDIDREGIRPQFKSAPSPAAGQGAIEACRLTPATQPLVGAR